MDNNLFLLYCHYGIKENYTDSQIIFRAIERSYRDFWRHISFQGKEVFNRDTAFERRSEYFLVENIHILFEVENQKQFDQEHYKMCNDLIQLYVDIEGITYGIVQRLINQTIVHLMVIESNLQLGYWNIDSVRKFFHVPVEKYTVQMATAKQKNKFQHMLHLQSAPLADSEIRYYMGYYSAEKVLPFEKWEFPEYIEYQLAIKRKFKKSILILWIGGLKHIWNELV